MALSLEKKLKAVKKEVEALGKKLSKIADLILKKKKPAKKKSAPKKKVATKKTAAKKKVVKKTAPKKKVAAKKKVAKKTTKKTITALETVYKAIPKTKKGVDVATLIKKTGFDKRKIYDNVKVLKKQGKIKSIGMGVYAKA